MVMESDPGWEGGQGKAHLGEAGGRSRREGMSLAKSQQIGVAGRGPSSNDLECPNTEMEPYSPGQHGARDAGKCPECKGE